MASACGKVEVRSGSPVTILLWRALLWTQGGYYLLTGIWPLISIESFQMVTGPKTDHLVTGREGDHWLVMTVAVLVVAIGAALCTAAWRDEMTSAIAVLTMGSALGLAGIDVIYVSREAIPPIYLADAFVEAVLIAAWAGALLKRHT
jgi:hypothetical protein